MSQSPEKKLKQDIQQECVNTIRVLGADIVGKSNSGHPGAPMGCALMADTLFRKVMKYDATTPDWVNRDRFVLSNGHACALLYTMLHLTGYERPTMDDLKNFRQLDSVTPGHPEAGTALKGVEVTTGPLGQGIAQAVGLAIAERHLAAVFNKDNHEIVNNRTFVLCGDGCLQEGVSGEASSLAGHLKLNKLIVLYDDNHITIDGETDLSFTEDVIKRYEAYGWNTIVVKDGDHDFEGIHNAVLKACESKDKPTLIKIKTTIGYGSKKQGLEVVHGAPLAKDDVREVKTKFGFNPDVDFFVSEEVKAAYRAAGVTRGKQSKAEWDSKFQAYAAAYPAEAAEFLRRMRGELPAGFEACLPTYSAKDGNIASRNSSEKVLNAIAKVMPELVGGSADLTGSNKTELKCTHDFQAATPNGRYLRFGVREHAMAAICNGLCAYGGLVPFGATFLNFVGYALGAMRLSALSHFRVLYIMTHDSIGLGEDGPTHQPIETLASLRSMPNMYVFRPADATEVAGSYLAALSVLKHSPSVLSLTRQDLPCMDTTSREGVLKGAYQVVKFAGNHSKKLCFVATGSEVAMSVAAGQELSTKHGIDVCVISMPCQEFFNKQSLEYKQSVFPKGVPIISVEAAATFGWEKYSHVQIGMTSFGASAPFKKLYERFGLDANGIVQKALKVSAFYENKVVPYVFDGYFSS